MQRTQCQVIEDRLVIAKEIWTLVQQSSSGDVLEARFCIVASASLLRDPPRDNEYWMNYFEPVILIEDWCFLFATWIPYCFRIGPPES